jgi:hypothetical protein
MLKITTLTEIESEEIRFLTPPYIPAGKLSLCVGDPAAGKSTLLLSIAAAVTTGARLPWEPEDFTREPADIIWQTTEDGYSDTVKPRLERLGADLSRVHTIDDVLRPLSLDDARIEQAIVEKNAALIVLDPITSYVGMGDINSSGGIRPALTNLSFVAERTGCAVICICHLCKKNGGKAAYRTLGSIDITAIARSVITVGLYPDDPDIRVFLHSKASLTVPGKPQSFGFDEASGIVWMGDVDITIDELLAGEFDEKKRNKQASQLEKAKCFISDTLSGGTTAAAEIKELAAAAGVAKNTLDRAKSALGVRSEKRGDAWFWSLPTAG